MVIPQDYKAIASLLLKLSMVIGNNGAVQNVF